MKIIFRCIGGSILTLYLGALFFVPGLIILMLLMTAILGTVEKPEYIYFPLCVVFMLGCIGYACYNVGRGDK